MAFPSRHLLLFTPFILLALGGGTFAQEMPPEHRAFFENKIRPVLVQQCYECHSGNGKKSGGKLLLDTPADMMAGGQSGPALVLGNPDESLIIQAVRYDGLEMPPKKKLPDQVVSDLVTWVKMGAPDPRETAPKKTRAGTASPSVNLWSLKPIINPEPPAVKDTSWPWDRLDNFVLAKIEAKGCAPTKDASREMLLRRVSYDIVGLAPTAAQMSSFSDGSKPLSRLVDEMLASPRFGERWGRYWLDVARYAESNGNDGLSRNASFPHAWRYRDYVIQAFNEDLPYDRFLTEQLAGDLLPAESPQQRDRHIIATGLLALGAKPAKAMNDNFDMDVIADQIEVVGSGIMGLSIGCARCHDHKTDPIPTKDYYALAGIFTSTETLWGAAAHEALTAPQTPLHELQSAPEVTPRLEIEAILKSHRPHRPRAQPAFKYPVHAPLAMGVREGKTVQDCKLNIGGDAKKLGAAVPRGFLTACGEIDANLTPGTTQSGRLQLAQWLTHSRHPLTARVLVNRVWLHLFGEGLVHNPDDFGAYSGAPANPELLDHLATRFMSEGWSIKCLIRNIVLSRTYQLSSEFGPELENPDPANRLLARHHRRRLDAEALRDTMLMASGEVDFSLPQGSLIQHRNVLINELPPLHQPSPHRSVYLLMLRNSMPPELTPFNLPDATAVTGKRDSSTLSVQSLYLLNNPFVTGQARKFAARLRQVSPDSNTRIRNAYNVALSREPTAAEILRAQDFIKEADLMLASSQNEPPPGLSDAWSAFCQALLVGNELRYVD